MVLLLNASCSFFLCRSSISFRIIDTIKTNVTVNTHSRANVIASEATMLLASGWAGYGRRGSQCGSPKIINSYS